MKKITMVILANLLALAQGICVYPFEIGSHRELSDRGVRFSKLDDFLKRELNVLKGVEDRISNTNRVIDWVVQGSEGEDDGTRFCNHFHNPLSNWSAAGLQLPVGILCQTRNHSSIVWGQNPSLQPSNESFTWQDARRTFFEGLTALNENERQSKLSRTFRALGHLIHLVQDAGNPAHTRNDPHPFVKGIEGFVESTRLNKPFLFAQLTSSSQTFDPVLLDAAPAPTGSLAPIPAVANIIDRTDSDEAAAVPSAGIDQGLAEYSNANFLSVDSSFNSFAFPSTQSLGPFFLGVEPLTLKPRIYFPKVSDGETVEHFVAIGTFQEVLESFGRGNLGFILDRRVFQDYAAKLLPRAIGYSAGLIDYFFRGKIEIAAPDRYAYALAPFLDGNTGSFTKMRFKVRNATENPDENTEGEGEIRAIIQYRAASGNLFENPFAPISPDVSFAVSDPQMVTLTRDFQELIFDFSLSPIPTNAADVFLTVVYKGKLGSEDGAVMVGGKDLFEPDPLDFANSTDYDCFQGILFQVSDFNLFPPYDPPLHTERDVDQDGIQDIFGPFVDRDMFIKTFDLSKVPPTPSASLFDFSVSEHSFAQYSRFVMLQDQPFYGFSWLIRNSLNLETGVLLPNGLFTFTGNGILNQVFVGPGGQLGRRITPTFTFRGVTTFHATATVNNPPRFSVCFGALLSVSPDLTRVEGNLPAE